MTLDAGHFDRALAWLETQSDKATHADTLLDQLCLDDHVDAGSVDLLVAFFLRLLAIDSSLVYGNRHRRIILSLVTERLQETNPAILRKYRLDANPQADEICRRLARVGPDAKESLTELIERYRGLEGLSSFRERLLRELNSSLCRAVIRPFLDFGGDTIHVFNGCLAASSST